MKAGSSPHTRGALAMPARTRRGWGIIPAYAGSTLGRRLSHRASSDHPRIRGEHTDVCRSRLPSGGSSPHTRGAPATLSCSRRRDGDHPRIRGEHCEKRHIFYRHGGIIPAYAGSTRRHVRQRRVLEDHPRIRGEHLCGLHRDRDRRWIIPAYAGSTVNLLVSHFRPSDHPRIRGEHIIGSIGMVIGWGSSPHTRGAHLGIPAIPRIAAVIIPVFLYPSPTPQEEADRSMVLLTLS